VVHADVPERLENLGLGLFHLEFKSHVASLVLLGLAEVVAAVTLAKVLVKDNN